MPDLILAGAGVPLAVRDLGGTGSPVILLHGAGGRLADLEALAERLRSAYRVVAVDLRGHGGSGDGPWTMDAVLADLDALVGELGLVAPAVVGWSLGGMVATEWARRHPECPGAVSLDGVPAPTRPEQLADLAPEHATAELARLHDAFAAMTAELARSGSRPGPETVEQVRRAMAAFDLLPALRATRCPLLLVLAPVDLRPRQPFRELYDAYRRATSVGVAEAVRVNPRLRVVELAGATHAMAVEQPERVAALVRAFLTDPGGDHPDNPTGA